MENFCANCFILLKPNTVYFLKAFRDHTDLTDSNELWSVGGNSEAHYFKVETGKSGIYKLENKENIWVVGDNNIIFHTTDNGKNWELQRTGLKKDIDLNAVTCTKEKCRTIGDYGTLLFCDKKDKK